MNTLLSTTYGDTLLLGLQVLAIGLATVFCVLVLIWGLLTLFKVFLAGSNTKHADKPAAAPIAAPAPIVANADDEIVAVIAAAIAMAESESCGGKFRVVSFRRK